MRTASLTAAVSAALAVALLQGAPASGSDTASRAKAYQATATTCGDGGVCKSVTMAEGSKVSVSALLRPVSGSLKGKYTFHLMSRTAGGKWKRTQSRTVNSNPWAAAWTVSLSPSRTTKYKWVIAPACFTPGTKDSQCQRVSTNTITVNVKQTTAKIRVRYLDTYQQIERGTSAGVMVAYEEQLASGEWTSNIAPRDVAVQRYKNGKWETVERDRTDEYGVVYIKVKPSGTSKYRFVTRGLTSATAVVEVVSGKAAYLSVSWPQYASVFGNLTVSVRLFDARGDAWQGSTAVDLQYRSNRQSGWVTIGSARWQRNSTLQVSGQVQGGGYYRVAVPEFNLAKEAFYS